MRWLKKFRRYIIKNEAGNIRNYSLIDFENSDLSVTLQKIKKWNFRTICTF